MRKKGLLKVAEGKCGMQIYGVGACAHMQH